MSANMDATAEQERGPLGTACSKYALTLYPQGWGIDDTFCAAGTRSLTKPLVSQSVRGRKRGEHPAPS